MSVETKPRLDNSDTQRPKRFVLYFHFAPLHNMHLKKDLEIARFAWRNGFESTLIVGDIRNDVDKSHDFFREVHVAKTGNVRRGKFPNVRDYPREFSQVIRLLCAKEPEVVLSIHPWIVAPLILLTYRLIMRVRRFLRLTSVLPRFILWMDSDGRLFTESGLRIFWRFVLLLNWMIFDKLITASTCSANRIGKYLPTKSKLLIIPHGYSSFVYKKTSYLETKREPVILTVARIVRKKGLDVLLSAFSIIHARFPDWQVCIAGPVEDEAYYRELLCEISKNQIGSKVHFLGYISEEDLRTLYNHSQIFCLPSREEGFPIARLEAAASGLPLVISEAGCGADLGRIGAIVGPTDNVNWLAKALTTLASDERLRIESSNKLQAHILSWEQVTTLILKSIV